MIDAVGEDCAEFVEAGRIATALIGDSIAANMFMLGFAYQRGLIPISAESIDAAIVLNGAARQMNKGAFLWGRRTAVDPNAVERLVASNRASAGTGEWQEVAGTASWAQRHIVALKATAPTPRPARPLSAPQISVCSEISRASSTSMPRYLTVDSCLVCPRSNCTSRRFLVRR